jgi:hypothetical protein
VTLVLAWVPNAVSACTQVLFTGSHTAVWLEPIAPNRTRPSASTHDAASPWMKLNAAGLSRAVICVQLLVSGSNTSPCGMSLFGPDTSPPTAYTCPLRSTPEAKKPRGLAIVEGCCHRPPAYPFCGSGTKRSQSA